MPWPLLLPVSNNSSAPALRGGVYTLLRDKFGFRFAVVAVVVALQFSDII